MYKWHVHSAIGRGRPVARDMQRAIDRLAASFRAFSVSATRCAQDDNAGQPPTSRSQRSQEVFSEASALAPRPTPRGIDARSLAAAPPTSAAAATQPKLKVTRIQSRGGAPIVSNRRPGVPRRTTRHGSEKLPGEGAGGAKGKGDRKRFGAGAGEKRKRGPKPDEELPDDPLSEEEKAYIYNHECGFPHPYQPTTSAESLARWGSSTIAGPRGIHENLMYKMQTATGIRSRYEHAGVHFHNMQFGNGLALFESPKERERAEEWKDTPGMVGRKTGVGSLSDKDRAAVFGAWVAGHYQHPMSQKEGVLGHVETFLRRNETYLPEDRRKLEAKLAELIPAATPVPTPQRKTA